jgi:hypothetical protein
MTLLINGGFIFALPLSATISKMIFDAHDAQILDAQPVPTRDSICIISVAELSHDAILMPNFYAGT